MIAKLTLAAASLTVAAFLAAAPSALATPPTRPIDIEPASEKEIQVLKSDAGAFSIPLRISSANADRGVVITTIVLTTDPLRPREVGRSQQRAEVSQKSGGLVARVPVMREAGVYKIEIAAGDANGAVYDRIILFQEVGKDGAARLYT